MKSDERRAPGQDDAPIPCRAPRPITGPPGFPWNAPRRLGVAGVLAFAFATASIAACQSDPASTLERVRREGFLRAGYSEEPPYAFFDDDSGTVGGESPESLRFAAEELGVEVRWVRLDFGDLIPSLLAGRIDVVAAGIYPTPERKKWLRFSRPSVCSTSAIVVSAGSGLTSIADVARDTAARLAVLEGSVEHVAAREMGIAERRIFPVPDLTTGIAALDEGSAAALAVTLPTARRAIAAHAHSALEARPYEPPAGIRAVLAGCSALAFRPEDVTLLNAVDRALADYVGSARHLTVLSATGFGRDDLPSSGAEP